MDNQNNQQEQAIQPENKKTGNLLFTLVCVVISLLIVIGSIFVISKLCPPAICGGEGKYKSSKSDSYKKAQISPMGTFKYENVSYGGVKAKSVSGKYSIIKAGMKKYHFKEIRIDGAEATINYNVSKINGKKIKENIAKLIKDNNFSAKRIIVTNSNVNVQLKKSNVKFAYVNAKIVSAKNVYKGSVAFTMISGNSDYSTVVDFEYNAKTGNLKIIKIFDEKAAPAFFKELVAAINK